MKIQRRQRYPILIYMLGFFLGIIYLNVASTRYVVDVGIWSEWFRSQYLGYDLKSFDYMWYVAQIRLLPAGGLAILGGTKFRKIAAYLFLSFIKIYIFVQSKTVLFLQVSFQQFPASVSIRLAYREDT